LFHSFSTTITGPEADTDSGDAAEELWDIILHGIAA
jgi:hypothetical protein